MGAQINVRLLRIRQDHERENYASILGRLQNMIRSEGTRLAKKRVPFHQDNAGAYKSKFFAAKVPDLRFQVRPHTPYSPNLAPSDYILFPNLKKRLTGEKTTSNKEATVAKPAYFIWRVRQIINNGY